MHHHKLYQKKKNASGENKYRVFDFHKLNSIIMRLLFRVTEIFDQLSKANYLTYLDMTIVYHQILLHSDDWEKTDFSSNQGHSEFKRMGFELKEAQASFHRVMNQVIIGFNSIKYFVYLYYAIIFGTLLEDHINIFKINVNKFQKYNLKLQTKKYEFFRKWVYYLGHIITNKGVKPNRQN